MDMLDKLIRKIKRNFRQPPMRLIMSEQHNKSISNILMEDKADNKQSMDPVTYSPEQVDDAISPKLSDLPDWFVIGAIVRWLYFKKDIALLDDILQSKEFSDIVGKTFEVGDKQRIEEMIERSGEVGFTYRGCVALLEWKWEFAINEKTKLYYVLKEIGEPVHCEKIHSEFNKHFPDDQLDLYLVSDILQTHSDIFISNGPDTYGLKRWNIANSSQYLDESLLGAIDETVSKANEHDNILHSERKIIDLPNKILSLLEKAGRPLCAREIARKLGKNENTLVDRREINKCLYSPELRVRIKQDSNYRWSISSISTSIAKLQDLDVKTVISKEDAGLKYEIINSINKKQSSDTVNQPMSVVENKIDDHTLEATKNNERTIEYKEVHEKTYAKSRRSNAELKYKKVTLDSFNFIPLHSVLSLRLVDLLDKSSVSENDLLDKLSEVPVSYLQLSDPMLADLRSNNVFPDDGFDGLVCCTIGYLLKLSQ